MISIAFYWIINLSITGTITAAFVVLLRFFKRIPRRVIFILWFIPYFRMILPFWMSNKFSLMSFLDFLGIRSVPFLDYSSFTAMNYLKKANTYWPFSFDGYGEYRLFYILSIIWIAGIVILSVYEGAKYLLIYKRFRNVQLIYSNIYICNEESISPFVFGVIKPKIIVPKGFDLQEAELIISHEMVHIKRKDNLRIILAKAVTIIHWFNIFSWIIFYILLDDMEMSCDEIVIKGINDKSRLKYAKQLIGYREILSKEITSFNGSNLRNRVRRIISFKSDTKKMIILSFLIIAIFVSCLLTNAPMSF